MASRKLSFAIFLLIAIAFYFRSWGSYFVCDDYEFLGRIDFHNAAQYLKHSWAYGNEYRPLLPYSYALDAKFSGGSPIGYHVTNTLIHICSVWLLVEIAAALGVASVTAFLAGLLYLMNPVSHEALLWISGRPVLLSALLQLLAIWFLLTPAPPGGVWRVAISVGCFLLALLVYEGSVALPFVLSAVFAASPRVRRECRIRDLVPFFAVLGGYLAFWSWTFRFHLVRQRQDSVLDAARSVVQAILHSWHGAYRPEVAPMYCVLLVWYLLDKRNRLFALSTLAIFLAAYVPFFVAKGFAPRFAYFPSAALCVLLASAIMSLIKAQRAIGLMALMALLVFNTLGMQSLINQWRDAGQIARRITSEIKELQPGLPSGTRIAISQVPAMYKHAYVYLTGLPRALNLAYGEPVVVVKCGDPVCNTRADYHFRYSGGHIQEVSCAAH